MIPTGRAVVAGVLGWPVAHSLSPRVHGFWLDRYGIDGAYVPLAVRPGEVADALRALARLGFAGANVTVPHKEAALAAMDEADETARRVGAVNTVVIGSDGALRGSSTDGAGFLESLRAALPRWNPAGRCAVVLGAGGAARAIAWALSGAGAGEVRIVNRTAERAAGLAAALGGTAVAVPWDRRTDAASGAALLVNATTLGMDGQPPLDLDLDALPRDAVVADIVYAPLETRLLAVARARGNPVVDGLGMLLHQARPGFHAWFGREPEVDEALRAFVLGGR